MRSISHHITPLVINSLGGGHTHTCVSIPTFVDKAILRNQARAGLWPARVWFKNNLRVYMKNKQPLVKGNLNAHFLCNNVIFPINGKLLHMKK